MNKNQTNLYRYRSENIKCKFPHISSASQRGITIIALIITIILMLILVTVTVQYSREAVDKTKLENIEIEMLLLQGKAKTIYEKYSFKEIETLVGKKYLPTETENISYIIKDEIKQILDSNLDAEYYIWEQQDFIDNGLTQIEVDESKFYIVDYISGEVYYSLGYTYNGSTYYSLTDWQSI